MKKSNSLVSFVFASVFLIPISYAGDMMQAEFRTLEECLAKIKQHSGSGKLKIVTDKPDEVSGFLSDGRAFGCEKKVTGTKGTYWEGYYFST